MTAIMSTTPKNSQTTWLMAMLGLSEKGATRVMKAIPMPESANEIGRMAGSASGASMRVAICATMKAPKMPIGTPRVCMLSACPSLIASIANIKMTSGDAMSSKMSSMLRLVMRHHRFPMCWGMRRRFESSRWRRRLR